MSQRTLAVEGGQHCLGEGGGGEDAGRNGDFLGKRHFKWKDSFFFFIKKKSHVCWCVKVV